MPTLNHNRRSAHRALAPSTRENLAMLAAVILAGAAIFAPIPPLGAVRVVVQPIELKGF